MSRRRKRNAKKCYTGRRAKEKQQPEKTTSLLSNAPGKQKDQGGKKKPAITGRRLWLFRISAIVIVPTLFFLLVEVGLRLAGLGYPAAATIKQKIDGRDFYCDNSHFSRRFFHRNIARPFDPFVIPADKGETTYRIFVLGGSAAKGTPEAAFCFGRMLQVMLREKYPRVHFEVINAGMTAINSHVVLEIARDFAQREPDLFVVYMGNNEVVGPYGAGTVFTPLSGNLGLIRAGIALKATRLGQCVSALSESTGKSHTPKIWRGMKMFLENQVRADDPGLKTVYDHFESNLQDIVGAVRKEETKVILCTVGSNLKDCAPFGSLHRVDLGASEKQKWDKIYQQAIAHEESGHHAEAVELYLSAGQIDNQFADLQFRLGRCYWALGEYEKARQKYFQARHFDTLRFRPDTQINDIIRRVAADSVSEEVYLVDAAKEFEKHSPHETTGEELFYEHVHMNFKGDYLLARTVFQQVEKIVPQWIKKRALEDAEPISEADCARQLVYTDRDRYLISESVLNGFLKKPPFTNQLYHDRQIVRFREQLKELKVQVDPNVAEGYAELYQQAINRMPSDFHLRKQYATFLSESKDHQGALEQLLVAKKYFPHHSKIDAVLGITYADLGKFELAVSHSLKALESNPVDFLTIFQLGDIYRRFGRDEEAMAYYSKAIDLDPEYSMAHTNLGVLQHKQGRVSEAVQSYRKVIELKPNAYQMYNNIGIIRAEQNRISEAIQTFRRGLEIAPDATELKANLANILFGLGTQCQQNGQDGKAFDYFSETFRLQPDNAVACDQLGILLYGRGRVDDAVRTYRKGLHFAPRSVKLHYNLGVILGKEGRRDEAVKELRTVLEIDPRSAVSTAVRQYLKSLDKAESTP